MGKRPASSPEVKKAGAEQLGGGVFKRSDLKGTFLTQASCAWERVWGRSGSRQVRPGCKSSVRGTRRVIAGSR